MKLHAAGVSHATSLIAKGAVDRVSDWEPVNGTEAVTDCCLGIDVDEANVHGVAAFRCVKDGKVFSAALKHCLATAEDGDIKAAARRLLNAIDDQAVASALVRRPSSVRGSRPTADLRQWYRMSADAPTTGGIADAADIYIYDDIGQYFDWDSGQCEGVSAKQFINDLRQLPESVTTIRVHINCRGGDPFEALAIANALRQDDARVEILIEGLCASAATIVSCAGDVIRMADNALYMVHQPFMCQCGNAQDFRAAAESLETIADVIVATYRWVSSLSAKALKALVDEETWMTADEALANGFITEIASGLKVAAALDRRVLNRVPDRFRDRVEAFVTPAPAVAAAEDVIRLCREGNCLALAESLISAKLPLAEVTARIEREKTTQAAATQRSEHITVLCATAKMPELAAGYIASAMPLDDVRTHLVTLQARMHSGEIDNGLKPGSEGGPKAKNTLSASAIYAERNKTKKE